MAIKSADMGRRTERTKRLVEQCRTAQALRQQMLR